MKLKCVNPECNYEWDYSGEHQFYATCPRCLRKVNLSKYKKLPKSKNMIKDIKSELSVKSDQLNTKKGLNLGSNKNPSDVLNNQSKKEVKQNETRN